LIPCKQGGHSSVRGKPGPGVGQGPYAHTQKISSSLLPNVTNAEPANSCPALWLGFVQTTYLAVF